MVVTLNCIVWLELRNDCDGLMTVDVSETIVLAWLFVTPVINDESMLEELSTSEVKLKVLLVVYVRGLVRLLSDIL